MGHHGRHWLHLSEQLSPVVWYVTQKLISRWPPYLLSVDAMKLTGMAIPASRIHGPTRCIRRPFLSLYLCMTSAQFGGWTSPAIKQFNDQGPCFSVDVNWVCFICNCGRSVHACAYVPYEHGAVLYYFAVSHFCLAVPGFCGLPIRCEQDHHQLITLRAVFDILHVKPTLQHLYVFFISSPGSGFMLRIHSDTHLISSRVSSGCQMSDKVSHVSICIFLSFSASRRKTCGTGTVPTISINLSPSPVWRTS